jgi:CheY-like chemotaxis protein
MTMKGSILVVDDEPGLLDVLEWELSSLGYDVLAVGNGTNAIEVLKQTDFDAVISDVRMPGISGLDLLHLAKGMCPDTEIIIATGYAEMETVVECVRGGAFDFIQKPFNLPSVMATVERAVERRRLRASSQLYQASLAISANRDPLRLPELIADGALKLLDADAVGLWLPDKTGVYLAHFHGKDPGAKCPLPADAVARVAALGRPKLLPQDAGGDAGLRLQLGSAIVFPLKVGDRVAGVLVVARHRPQAANFRRGDVERMSALASQVLLALENVRLATQAASNERLATIGQLAAGVAHEINNPVSYVLMSLESATDLLGDVAQGDVKSRGNLEEALADALEGTGRIRDIVGDRRTWPAGPTGRRRSSGSI